MTTVIKVGEDTPRWVPAGVHVHKGDVVAITATGTISVQNQSRPLGPDGQKTLPPDSNFVTGKLNAHALIGMISPTAPRNPLTPNQPPREPFLVGDSTQVTADEDGDLYFIVNDNLGFFFDNTGAFDVTADLGTDVLTAAGSDLTVGQDYFSSNRAFRLQFQTDGNLVVYKGPTSSSPIWYLQKVLGDNGWAGHKRVVFDTDGNLAVLDDGDVQRWISSPTDGNKHPGAHLQLSDSDGTLTIVDGGRAVWSSK